MTDPGEPVVSSQLYRDGLAGGPVLGLWLQPGSGGLERDGRVTKLENFYGFQAEQERLRGDSPLC